jgi:hypothetical protein
MVRARMSQVQIPIVSLDFLNLTDPFSRIVALDLTRALTEMSIGNLPRG